MITKKLFGNYNGQEIYAYTLSDGISVTISQLGATVIELLAPDKNGNMVDVALGMTNPQDTVSPKGDYMGCVVGRCGNRIAKGKFTLDGVDYTLDCNNGQNHLHGGFDGFHKKVYDVTVGENCITMYATSKHLDQGYPHQVDYCVKYTVVGKTLCIQYFGESDGTTLFNPTNHTYFNLNGQHDGSILDNVLQIFADTYLEIDQTLLPQAQANVAGTPFDFRTPKAIGQDIDTDHIQLQNGSGYDHNFCLNGNHCAHAYSIKTGITLDCYTDMPGVQFYSGNFLCGNLGKAIYPKRSGFCLETQFWPDAINHDNFRNPILKKGEKFYSQTKYVFGTK